MSIRWEANRRPRPVLLDHCHGPCGGGVSCELDPLRSHQPKVLNAQRRSRRLRASVIAARVATDSAHRAVVLANLRFVGVVRRDLVIRRDCRRDRHCDLHWDDVAGDVPVV